MIPEPLFRIAGQDVNLYLLFHVLGVIPVAGLGLRLGRERGVSPIVVLDAWIIGGAAAWIGVLLTGSGLGATVTALGAWWLFFALHSATRAKPLEALDIWLPGLALYQVLRRLGCFSAGCCHGKPAYGLPWAATFSHPASSCIYQGIPVHPTQLYCAAGNLVIFLMLMKLSQRSAFRGALAWIYLSAYGLLRFVVAFYLAQAGPMVGRLSWSQVVCLALVAIGIIGLARRFLTTSDGERGRRSLPLGTPAK